MKVVHAAWLRDNTWPAGAVAPEPDDILLDDEPPLELPLTALTLRTPLTEQSSGVTTPWMVVNGQDIKLDEEENTTDPTDPIGP